MAKKASTIAHGYSGKPLFQKLGLKPGMRCLLIGAPEHYLDLVSDAEGVGFHTRIQSADVVHLFFANRKRLDQSIEKALERVAEGGMLWVSWPKKSSDQFVDLTEDQLRTVILPTGWVDVKVCAVDETLSGLKFLRRRT